MTSAAQAQSHRRRRLHSVVGHHEGGIGVAAAHHSAVAAEQLHVAAFGQRGTGQDLGGELHTLAPDACEQHLALHRTSVGRRSADSPRSLILYL